MGELMSPTVEQQAAAAPAPPSNVREMKKPEAKPPVAVRVKEPELVKVGKLHNGEQDEIWRMVVAMRSATLQRDEASRFLNRVEQDLQEYCVLLMRRHKVDPAIHAIDPSFVWIVEVPKEKLEAKKKAQEAQVAAMMEAAKKQRAAMPPEPDPSAPGPDDTQEPPALDVP